MILCASCAKACDSVRAERFHTRRVSGGQRVGPWLEMDMMALVAEHGQETQVRARTLFASVLDASGGGLRIQTIHSFCQTLLSAFPIEADLVPGFRPLDQREQKSMARAALADLLVRAEAEGDTALIADMQSLSLRLGEEGAENFLMR